MTIRLKSAAIFLMLASSAAAHGESLFIAVGGGQGLAFICACLLACIPKMTWLARIIIPLAALGVCVLLFSLLLGYRLLDWVDYDTRILFVAGFGPPVLVAVAGFLVFRRQSRRTKNA